GGDTLVGAWRWGGEGAGWRGGAVGTVALIRATTAESRRKSKAVPGSCRLKSKRLWTRIAKILPPPPSASPAISGSLDLTPRQIALKVKIRNQSAMSPPATPQSATT